MTLEIPHPVVKGKKAPIVGIANEHSTAHGCAADGWGRACFFCESVHNRCFCCVGI